MTDDPIIREHVAGVATGEYEVLEPLEDRIVCRRIEEPAKSEIIVEADTYKHVSQRALVGVVGPGRLLDEVGPDGKVVRAPMTIKPGDLVLLGRHAGTDFTINGITYVVCHEREVYGVLVRKRREAPVIETPKLVIPA